MGEHWEAAGVRRKEWEVMEVSREEEREAEAGASRGKQGIVWAPVVASASEWC